MPVFTLPYTITDEEYLAFNDHHLRYTPLGRKTLRNGRLFIALFGVLLLGLSWLHTQKFSVWLPQLVVVGVCIGLGCGCFRRGVMKTTRRMLKKAHKTGKYLYSTHGELTVDFDRQVITDKTEKATIETPFSSVERFYETEVAFYLYIDQKGGFIVPYRLFSSTDEFTSFRDAARTAFQK